VVSSLREWDFKEVVPGQNSIGRPKNVERETLSSSLQKREMKGREREREREREGEKKHDGGGVQLEGGSTWR